MDMLYQMKLMMHYRIIWESLFGSCERVHPCDLPAHTILFPLHYILEQKQA